MSRVHDNGWRMAGDRIGDRLMECGQRSLIRGQIDLTLLHPLAQQREGREQPAGARVLGQLAEKGLRVDGLFEQRRKLFRIEEQQPFPVQERRGIRDG